MISYGVSIDDHTFSFNNKYYNVLSFNIKNINSSLDDNLCILDLFLDT